MRIRLGKEGPEFEAPTASETEQTYFGHLNRYADERVECRCGFLYLRGQLRHEIDVEQMHPLNRQNPRCTFMDRSGCHWTAFEKCPKCRRCVFADGRWVQ